MNTDLIIVGGGAAGLMAAATAGETGLKCVVLERRHRAGLKLLLCGNNRCNVTHDATAEALLAAYGEPAESFLTPAVTAFPPAALRRWFAGLGLSTIVQEDGRVYPRSMKADDVVHCFTDCLRDRGVPLVLNCPVVSITRDESGFHVTSESLVLHSPNVLIATGGVSYPKTGSVGDGQVFAKSLGHHIEPYRPGLAGIELGLPWLQRREDISFPETHLHIIADGHRAGTSEGEILCSKPCARGPAIVNASRIISRHLLKNVALEIDLFPRLSVDQLASQLERSRRRTGGSWSAALAAHLPDPQVARDLFAQVIQPSYRGEPTPKNVAETLKRWVIDPVKMRPLKEAMVTIGGVTLGEIDPLTMASRSCDGLCFAGEVMDVDGPTGGYNLHAAFATARLAVETLAATRGLKRAAPKPAPHQNRSPRPGRRPAARTQNRTARRRP